MDRKSNTYIGVHAHDVLSLSQVTFLLLLHWRLVYVLILITILDVKRKYIMGNMIWVFIL